MKKGIWRLADFTAPGMIDVKDVFRSCVDYKAVAIILITGKDTHHWTRHIALRDYLRVKSSKSDEYFELKSKLCF